MVKDEKGWEVGGGRVVKHALLDFLLLGVLM